MAQTGNRHSIAASALRAARIAAFAALTALAAFHPARTAAASDPIALYGGAMSFDVLRDGSRIGRHEVRFERDGDQLRVVASSRLRVDLLFLTLYRFDYRSESVWRDGRLERLEAAVDDDGATTAITARRDGGALVIDGPKGRIETEAPLFPTNHWNAAVLGESRVLNTLTGSVAAVEIEALGRETVDTGHGPVPATRWAYSGDLEAEVWYDDEGRWIGMRFRGRDGSTIDYVCRRCQDRSGNTASR